MSKRLDPKAPKAEATAFYNNRVAMGDISQADADKAVSMHMKKKEQEKDRKDYKKKVEDKPKGIMSYFK